MNQLSHKRQAGFTIMELMIATVILSVLLLVASAVLIAIGRLYTKGTTGAALQNNARNIVQTLTSGVQYATSDAQITSSSLAVGPVTVYSVCAGSVDISFVPNTAPGSSSPLGGPPIAHTIWEQTTHSGCPVFNLVNPPTVTPDQVTNSQNIGLSNEAIHTLTITPAAGSPAPGGGTVLWQVKIDAYAAAGADQIVNAGNPAAAVACNGNVGDQFCFTAALTTVTTRRLE